MAWVVERGVELLARAVAATTAACLRHRAWVLVLAAALCAWLGVGLARIEAVSSIRGFMPEDDPELARFARFLEEFPSDSGVLVVAGCPGQRGCESVLEPDILRAFRELEADLAQVEGYETITGLWSAPIFESDGVSISPRFLSETDLENAKLLDEFAERLLAEPLLEGAVLSKDRKTAGILLEGVFWSPGTQSTRSQSVDRLLEITSRFEETSGLTTFGVGPAFATKLSNRNTRQDLRLLTPLMLAAVVIVFGWIFRGVVVAIAPMIAVGVATLLSFGLMGHLGVPITTVSSVLPTLIVVIGVTDAMHLLTRYFHHRDLDHADALVTASRELGVPSLVTALTGSAGLLSFLLGPMPRLREFGVFASIGVLGGFVTTFTLLPVLISLFPPRSRVRPGLVLGDRLLERVRSFSLRNPGRLLAAAAVVLALAALGISSLRVQNELLELLDEGDYQYRSEVFVRDNLRPTRTLEVIFDAREPGQVARPAALREIAAVEALLEQQAQIPRVDSMLDLLRRVTTLLEIETPDATGLPARRGEAEEALFVLETSAPDTVGSFMSVDRSLVRLSAGFLYSDTRSDLATIERVRAALPRLAPSWDASITGTTSLSVRLSELILETQVSSFSGALVTIFVILAVLVGSLRLAALGMIPNLVPIVATLGLMGAWGIRLDVGTAMVASILIGISVDDTVYFLVHYRDARRRGLGLGDAIAYTFAFSGKAAIFASAILAGGFTLLTFSRFQTLAYFGLLSAVAVAAALACELLLLPAVLERALALGRRWRAWRGG